MPTNRICLFVAPTLQRPLSKFHGKLHCLLFLAAIAVAVPCASLAQQIEIASLPDPMPAEALGSTAPAPETPQTAAPPEANPVPEEASLPDAAPLPQIDLADSTDQAPAGAEAAVQQSTPTSPSTSDALPPVTEQIRLEPAKPRKRKPESEIAIQGMASYGNWQIFAAGLWEHLYVAGFEYDRHTWGKFIGAQMDYAADFMPLVLLTEPLKLNPYGIRRSKPGVNVTLHGLAFSPIGLRMEWRPTKAFKPYFTVKGGAIGFTKKALSPDGSYFDFTLHESVGFYLKMTQRVDVRFGLFSDFHFSNAYITQYNPGLDNMNSQLGISYHLGS